MSGYIFTPSYGGYWRSYNGESEELPVGSYSTSSKNLDVRAQAFGEGWFDQDDSTIHAYLAFRFTPPNWGNYRFYVTTWLHGFYQLYSNDEWYNSEYARAELDTWTDFHQYYWGGRQYQRRFTMSGQELHPMRSGRIDSGVGSNYYATLGKSDTVTIRAGVRLHCKGKSDGYAKLNFRDGAGNYVHIPYVYWTQL